MTLSSVASPASRDLFSGMPEEIVCKWIGYDPDSVRALLIVSRELKRISEGYLHANTEGIVRLCSHLRTPLDHLLYTSIEPNGMRFYASIPGSLRSLHLPAEDCTDRIFSIKEIDRFNQRILDENLGKIWGRMHPSIVGANPHLTGVPGAGEPAPKIHLWLQASGVQSPAALRLHALDLTCVPTDALWTGLRKLYLNNNALTFLPGRFFSGMTRLEVLSLEDNQLTSLPEDLFLKLSRLQLLYLHSNRLASLPEGIFQGPAQLQILTLHSNQLTSLSGDLFRGLPRLRMLNLKGNQLASLPPSLFKGLERLEGINLSGNRLTSLPGDLFCGLPGLQEIDLDNNQLTALSPKLFQEVSRLQELYLHGNPRLLASSRELRVSRNNISFRREMRDFFNYPCRTPFARFYQFAAGNPSPEALQRSFSTLDAFIKIAIFEWVHAEAGSPDPHGAAQWGEIHAFDDLQIFNGALKRYVEESFSSLTQAQKNGVYCRVSTLAHRSLSGPHWGELHAHDNILRLIDAMIL